MSDTQEKKLEINYGDGLRRMGLDHTDQEFKTVEALLDSEDFERFNESFMSAREKMVDILVNYGPADQKRRTLRAMIAHDHTKQLMDVLMERKREMESLLESEALGEDS